MLQFIKHLHDLWQGKTSRGMPRSSQWRKVRAQHLKDNPACAVCGTKTKLEVHHLIPFHVNPALELEPSNLITLCENKKFGINCHLLIGHLGSYRRYNTECLQDAKTWAKKLDDSKSMPPAVPAASTEL